MASKHFRDLNSELKRLRTHFLPRQLRRYSGSRAAKVQDGVRAYLVLAHAAVEEYLEQAIRDVVDAEYKRWQSRRRQSRPVIAVFIEGSYQRAQEIIKDNHGIRERNLRRLLKLVGINVNDPNQVDPTWLADMDSFGKLRGGLAHRSGVSLGSIMDPFDAKRKVDNLLRGLRDLDRRLQKLKR